MADVITSDQLEEKKTKNPGIQAVCYVNSTAPVKAGEDICCTYVNAVQVVDRMLALQRHSLPFSIFALPNLLIFSWTEVLQCFRPTSMASRLFFQLSSVFFPYPFVIFLTFACLCGAIL